MTQSGDKLVPHEVRLLDMWERMVRTIGIHTVKVLFDRAVWEASQKHPELALIEHDGDSLSFEALHKSFADKPDGQIAEAFNDLTSELLLILARLLGKEMAQRLAEELRAKMAADKPAGKAGKGGGRGTDPARQ